MCSLVTVGGRWVEYLVEQRYEDYLYFLIGTVFFNLFVVGGENSYPCFTQRLDQNFKVLTVKLLANSILHCNV